MDQAFKEEAIKCFSTLPPEETREYEKQIARFAAKCHSTEQSDALLSIIESNSDVAFEAFFCLCTVYRRNRDYELLRNLLFNYECFSDHISYNHLVIQYQVHSEALFDYDELLEMAYADARKMKQNAGYLQSFCNAFATICEQCNDNDVGGIIDRWYSIALDCINKAIQLDPHYAKFYSTKARIIAFNNEFAEANRLITQAISLEDSSRPDYAITILNYQYSKSRFAIMQQKKQFNERIEELENQVQLLKGLCRQAPNAPAPEDRPEPETYDGELPYIFVSYAHQDKENVYNIISSLQKSGIRIWYDKGLRAGNEWPEEIGAHLEKSDTVIVFLSSNAIVSKYVRREINVADSNNKRIIPVVIDDCQLTIGIKLQLGLNQMMFKNALAPNDFIDKLGKECGKNVGYSF